MRVKTKLSIELGVREHDKQLRTQQVAQKMAASALFRFLSFKLALYLVFFLLRSIYKVGGLCENPKHQYCEPDAESIAKAWVPPNIVFTIHFT